MAPAAKIPLTAQMTIFSDQKGQFDRFCENAVFDVLFSGEFGAINSWSFLHQLHVVRLKN